MNFWGFWLLIVITALVVAGLVLIVCTSFYFIAAMCMVISLALALVLLGLVLGEYFKSISEVFPTKSFTI